VIFSGMAVSVEMHHTGDAKRQRDVGCNCRTRAFGPVREKVPFSLGWSWSMIYVYFSERRLQYLTVVICLDRLLDSHRRCADNGI
jgi:hypothetical protein